MKKFTQHVNYIQHTGCNHGEKCSKTSDGKRLCGFEPTFSAELYLPDAFFQKGVKNQCLEKLPGNTGFEPVNIRQQPSILKPFPILHRCISLYLLSYMANYIFYTIFEQYCLLPHIVLQLIQMEYFLFYFSTFLLISVVALIL